MVNEMILGTALIGTHISQTTSSPNSTSFEPIRSLVLDEYLSPHLWDLPTSNEQIQISTVLMGGVPDKRQQLTVEKLDDNVLTVSLLVEGIGNLAEVMEQFCLDEYPTVTSF